MNKCWRLRESSGLFIGESIKFLKVMEGFPEPPPKTELRPPLLFPASAGIAVCFAGEPTERSKPEFELFCLAGHTSSLGPGVSGVKGGQSARNKSSAFGNF